MYRLYPVKCNGRYYEINHLFSQEDIRRLMSLPKTGSRKSFEEAFELRWLEGSYQNRLFTYQVLNMPLYDYCLSRNYYIEFQNDEIEWVES